MREVKVNTSALSLFRFLAIVTVIMVHYAQEIDRLYLFPFGVTRAGAIITFFFLLSGFGLFLGYRKQERINYREYLYKRAFRILPVYYLALLMMAALLLAAGRFSVVDFFLSLFTIQPWLPGYQHAINPPGWFVADLLFFYLVFPLIHAQLKTRKPDATKLLQFCLLLWIGSVLLLNTLVARFAAGHYNFVDCFPLAHFPSFLMGVCGAYFVVEKWQKFERSSRYSFLGSLLVVLAGSLVILLHQGEIAKAFEVHLPFEANLYAPLYLLMIIQLSTARNIMTKILSLRFWGLLATISYPLYILQAPFHSVYTYVAKRIADLSPWPGFLLFLALFMLFASLVTVAEMKIFSWLRERQAGS